MNKSAHDKRTARPTRLQMLHAWRNYFFAMALILTTLLAYRPVWHGTPLIADQTYLITKPDLRTASGLVTLLVEPQTTKQYHPLVNTVFWVGNKFCGSSMLGYHLIGIFLHTASALLLWKILRQLEIAGAWLAAALFALHPVQVDSVAWLAEIKNTLSGVFFFSCILAYLHFDQTRNRRAYALALFLFCVGLLAKAIVAMAVVVLSILFWWKRGRLQWKRDLQPLIPFVLMGIASGLATAWMERKFSGAEGEAFAFSFLQRLLIAGRAFWFYLSKSFWPANLSFVYPRWNVNAQTWWQWLFPFAMACLFALAWSLRKRWSWFLAGLLVFGVILSPLLGFFNVLFFNYSFVADHFQYLPILGIIVPVSAGGTILLKRFNRAEQIVGYGLVFALLGGLALLTLKHSVMYRDVETCSRLVLEKNPNHWPTRNNLGTALLQKGDLDGALSCFEIALENAPSRPGVQKNTYRNIGDVFSSFDVARFRRSASRSGQCPAPQGPISRCHQTAENGQFSQAVETAERALQLAEQQRKEILVRALPHEISLYQTSLPYHELSR